MSRDRRALLLLYDVPVLTSPWPTPRSLCCTCPAIEMEVVMLRKDRNTPNFQNQNSSYIHPPSRHPRLRFLLEHENNF
ncbi:hypothetical protein GGU10DRAFT_358072 [Lentinula aff. detonsa]|uniref:Uncharacterized protein n=1 Tax=Lentinula aff. detonsa TaxID=2804958 RepID=A0AA38K9J7_9AGAR|nr:hypothetical protein GGU10DRAFT_358072 [Lentinula aff. detonsa]